MIAITIIGLVLVILVTRIIEFILFMKKVSKTCHKYDWKYVNKHPMCLLDMMKNRKGYYMTNDWSAYNFLYLKGPNPKSMFLSFKKLTIENQYNKKIVDRLKEYEII
jgi:hypothetical protein